VGIEVRVDFQVLILIKGAFMADIIMQWSVLGGGLVQNPHCGKNF